MKTNSIKDCMGETISYEDNYQFQIKRNELSNLRIIGLTIETKPDWCLEPQINEALDYGCTRFEIGVQTLNENCLKKTNRGHTIEETKKSFQVAKDMCFKINAHMMLGLPASDLKIDEKGLTDLFELEEYKPDMLKIYPTLVNDGTPLYKMFQMGLFKPINTKIASEIIARSYKKFPRWVRVMRVQRDIPTNLIKGGVENSNLRQYVELEMKKLNIKSCDIRSREIGLNKIKNIENQKNELSKVYEFENNIKKIEFKKLDVFKLLEPNMFIYKNIDNFIKNINHFEKKFIEEKEKTIKEIEKISLNKKENESFQIEQYKKQELIIQENINSFVETNFNNFLKKYFITKLKTATYVKLLKYIDYETKYSNFQAIENRFYSMFLKINFLKKYTKKLITHFEEGNFNINIEEYLASEGKEFFLDVVNKEDILIGFIRLRFPSQTNLRKEITKKTALIRELHIYGKIIPVGHIEDKSQHKGWGTKLVKKCEEISKENGFEKIAIISGVGVRAYYKKLGYELEGNYMIKEL
jgi:histone acetyltransferase (RNA polymerase elongator complex component)